MLLLLLLTDDVSFAFGSLDHNSQHSDTTHKCTQIIPTHSTVHSMLIYIHLHCHHRHHLHSHNHDHSPCQSMSCNKKNYIQHSCPYHMYGIFVYFTYEIHICWNLSGFYTFMVHMKVMKQILHKHFSYVQIYHKMNDWVPEYAKTG